VERREFLGAVTGGLLATPLTAIAQQAGKVYRIGVLTNVRPTTPEVSRNLEAFRQGLRELIRLDRGSEHYHRIPIAEGNLERLPSLAAELVNLKPDIIVAITNAGARAAQEATRTIPIVMAYVFDPVGAGLVPSLARPGGNLTGLTFVVSPEIAGKQLEFLKEAVAIISRVAVFVNPTNQASTLWKETHAAAQALGLRLQPVKANSPNDLEGAFATMRREHANAVLILPLPLTYAQARRIAELAAKGQLPTVYPFKEGAEVGGLMAYGARAPDMFRRAAGYVDKILKGAKPADLPIEQPTKFELVINLKTAKALGLTIPPSLLARADEVIQ